MCSEAGIASARWLARKESESLVDTLDSFSVVYLAAATMLAHEGPVHG